MKKRQKNKVLVSENPKTQICNHCGQEVLRYEDVHDLILCMECAQDYWREDF